MRVIWNRKNVDGVMVNHGRYGLIHFEYTVAADGNIEYLAYVRSGGKRHIVIKVIDNPAGDQQIDPRTRLAFIGACLDNFLSFDLLEVEKKPTSIVDFSKKPQQQRLNEVCGMFINRTYVYNGSRGTHYYRVYSVMNNCPTNDSRVILVGYRDIFTGDEWGCAVDNFTSTKYQLLPLNFKIPAPSDFILQRRTQIRKVG